MALQIDDDGNVYDDGVIDGNSDNEFVIPTPSSGSQGWQQDELGNFYKIDSSGDLTFRDDKGTDYTYNPSKGGFTDSKGNLAGGGNTVIDFLKKYGNKALDLFKDAKTGKTDWTKVLAMAGGAYAASRPNNIAPTGYQGKIPKLTASRNMLTAPPVGRRPGSGGIDYGGGVTYRDESGKVLSSNERTLEELRQAAINNPFNRGATYEGQTSLGQTDLQNLLAALNPPTTGAPSTTGTSGTTGTPSASGDGGPVFVTGPGDTGRRRERFDGLLPEGTTMAMDPRTGMGNTVTTNGVTRPYSPVGGTMYTNEERSAMQHNQDLAARKARREAQAAGATPVDPAAYPFVITAGDGQPLSNTTPGFVAPIYNPAVLPTAEDREKFGFTSPYAAALANPNTIPLMSGETQEQGLARLQSQHDALMAKRASRGAPQAPTPGAPDMGKVVMGMAKGGLARDGFVLPADVVSHYGNGSSEAGLKLLAERIGATPIKGEGDGMSDSIRTKIDGVQEARVANDEAYVSPEMVAKLGNGNPEKGAKKLYAMMDQVRKARTGTTKQGKEIDPNKYMPGGSVQRYQTGGTTATTRPVGATGSESSLSNWAGDYVTNMLGQGAALANAPYQAYTGPLTAGASGLQQQGFAQAGNLRTPGSIGQAAGTAGGIANLAANMRYTPQTMDFLGGANMSGLGMAPSYGMGMPQQPTGTMTNPIPMPRGNDNPKFLGHGPYRGEYGGSQYDPVTGFESRDLMKLQPGDPRLEGAGLQTKPFREPSTGGTTPLPFEDGLPEMPQYGQPIQTGSRPGSYDLTTMDPSDPMYDTMYNYMKQGREQLMASRPSESFQTKPFRGESSEPFMQDGAMTGGVMSPPGQEAGLPGLMPSTQGRQQPQASQPVGSIAQQYMNPYLQSALNPMMDEARRQADISRMDDAGRLTRAGAFGGGRQAIMESEGRRNLMEKQNQLLTMGYSTAYDKAMQQFNADQARRAQEAQFGATFGLQGLQTGLQGAQTQGQLGAQQSQSDINNLRAIMDAGAVERGIESEGIAADKKQFEEARLNPFNMLQFQQSLLSGMPLASQSYSMPGQSNLQQFAGGATTIQQLLDILSGKRTAAAK